MALAAGSLSAGWTYHYNFDFWFQYGLFAFSSVIGVYNLQRLYKLRKGNINVDSKKWTKNHEQQLLAIGILTLFVSLFLFWHVSKNFTGVFCFLVSTAIVSTFYVVPIRGTSLREIPILKSLLIALVWVSILFVFPWLNEWNETRVNPFSFLSYFFFFFSLAILFDLRDENQDHFKKRTIAQLLGSRNSLLISILFLVIFTSLIAIINYKMRSNVVFWFVIAFLGYLIITTNDNKKELHFLMLDGSMILLGLSYFCV